MIAPRLLASALLVGCGAAPPPAAPTPVIGEAATLIRCDARDESDEYEPYVDEEDCLAHADERAIARRVREAATAELFGVDASDLYTTDARRTYARAAAEGPMDLTFDAVAARARDALLVERGGGVIDPEADSYTVGYERLEIRREGDTAHLSGTLLELLGMGEDSSSSAVEVDLVRVDGAWRIQRWREWPLHWAIPDEGETYGAEHWAARDAEVAAAYAALAEDPSLERRRVLVDRLLAAMRYAEALEASAPLIAAAPNVDDLAALARIEALLGHAAESREAAARAEAPTTPIRTIDTAMRGRCTRPREVPYDEEDDRDDPALHCDFEVLAAFALDGEVRGVALVRVVTGPEAAETTRLYVHDRGYWMDGPTISDGPFVGDQTDGVTRFEVSNIELAELDAAAPPELRARYERTRIDDGDEANDAGWLVCALGEAPACGLFPERTARTVGDATTVTEHAVTFDAGQLRVRRTRGPPDAEVRTGTLALGDALTLR